MHTKKGDLRGLNYVKHYYLSDGTCAGDQHGSYEVDIARFPAGTGEKMADEQIDMLKELAQ